MYVLTYIHLYLHLIYIRCKLSTLLDWNFHFLKTHFNTKKQENPYALKPLQVIENIRYTKNTFFVKLVIEDNDHFYGLIVFL